LIYSFQLIIVEGIKTVLLYFSNLPCAVMDFRSFIASVQIAEPPPHLSLYLLALWHDARGNWHEAHKLVDSLDDKLACRLHAYLHRKEGDEWNAAYWYRKAGEKIPAVSLQQEWEDIVQAVLRLQ
jgi:hypothetical protein